MKTEKQIKLMKEQGGREFEKILNSNEIDIITIKNENKSRELYGKFDTVFKEGVKYAPVPILQQGIFENYIDENIISYMLFSCTPEDETMKIDMQFFSKINDVMRWLYSTQCEIKFIYDDLDEFNYFIKGIVTPEMKIYTKQNRGLEYVNKFGNEYILKNSFRDPIEHFFDMMALLNYLQEHLEEKEISNERENKSTAASKSKHKLNTGKTTTSAQTTTYKPRTIKLNGFRIKTNSNKVERNLTSRSIHRVTSSWSVRGHFRHYKSGKVVYIKPYTKGNNTSQRVKKIYEIE